MNNEYALEKIYMGAQDKIVFNSGVGKTTLLCIKGLLIIQRIDLDTNLVTSVIGNTSSIIELEPEKKIYYLAHAFNKCKVVVR